MHRFIAGGLVGLALVLQPMAAQAQTTIVVPTPIPALNTDPRWLPTADFRGTGTRTMEPFTVTTSDWRVTWRTRGEGMMAVVVENWDDRTPVTTHYSHGPEISVQEIHEPGRYYLRTRGSGPWTAVVEELRAP